MENAKAVLTGNVEFAWSASDCAGRADVLVITTPWPEFRQLQPQDVKHSGARPTVLDCWRLLGETDLARCTDYLILGVGANGRQDPKPETQAF
jgi:UDPglucose 6-dehydrogenase